jgi:hypothetical protein
MRPLTFDDWRDRYNGFRNQRPVLTAAELLAAYNEGYPSAQVAAANDELAAEYDAVLEEEYA